MSRRKTFRVNKRDAKWMGVCAGIGDFTGVDATIVRIAMVLLTLAGGFPWTVIAYVVAGFVAKPKAGHLAHENGAATQRLSTYELKAGMRDIDRRMAEVESYVTHANTRLAREIEELR